MPIYIKNTKKLLFIHIPKSAGSSIDDSLAKRVDFVALNAVTRKQCFDCSPQHFHHELLNNMFKLSELESISVVRHPLLRIISEHQYRNRLRLRKGEKVLTLQKDIAHYFHQYKFNKYIYDNHVRPQFQFVSPETKIFKFETSISSVVDYACGYLDIDSTKGQVKSLKKSEDADILITPTVANLVNEFYEGDFDLFDYEKIHLAKRETINLRELRSTIEHREVQNLQQEHMQVDAVEWECHQNKASQLYKKEEKTLAFGFSILQAALKVIF